MKRIVNINLKSLMIFIANACFCYDAFSRQNSNDLFAKKAEKTLKKNSRQSLFYLDAIDIN